jgi:hypothetical protein
MPSSSSSSRLGATLLLLSLPHSPASAAMWELLDLHLFVDTAGIAAHEGLVLVQHPPQKTYEMVVLPDKPWDGGGLQHGAIAGYCSAIQVSPTELRIYYDTFGQYGRFLCVAVSKDAGKTWVKPVLNLIEFDGSKANNIVAGTQINSSSVKESIEPGTVFIDERPGCPTAEKFKMVISWGGGAAMFASADGFDFVNMTAKALLKGSDSQDVVFWDHRVGRAGAYVYYGRSHLKGGQNESCAASLGGAAVAEPGRSVNHFVIGQDLLKWPISSADQNATELTILNTDVLDPPCIDIYTNQATPLGDAYFFFPMMYLSLSREKSAHLCTQFCCA